MTVGADLAASGIGQATRVARPGRSAQGGRGRAAGARGSATAEFAVALPAVVVVLAMALWAVSVVEARLRCVDAARAGARAAARGEAPAMVEAAVAAAAPAGATVSVTRTGGLARVEVVAVFRPAWAELLPPVTLSASAVAATEPGVTDPPGGGEAQEPAGAGGPPGPGVPGGVAGTRPPEGLPARAVP